MNDRLLYVPIDAPRAPRLDLDEILSAVEPIRINNEADFHLVRRPTGRYAPDDPVDHSQIDRTEWVPEFAASAPRFIDWFDRHIPAGCVAEASINVQRGPVSIHWEFHRQATMRLWRNEYHELERSDPSLYRVHLFGPRSGTFYLARRQAPDDRLFMDLPDDTDTFVIPAGSHCLHGTVWNGPKAMLVLKMTLDLPRHSAALASGVAKYPEFVRRSSQFTSCIQSGTMTA